MKRLIKAENGNYIDKIRREVMEKSDNDTNMIKLQELDAADVKNDFCIECGDNVLHKIIQMTEGNILLTIIPSNEAIQTNIQLMTNQGCYNVHCLQELIQFVV